MQAAPPASPLPGRKPLHTAPVILRANDITDLCQPLRVTGLRGASIALFAAEVAKETGRPLLLVTPGEEGVDPLAGDLAFFTGLPVFTLPPYDIPPYAPLSPDPATVAERIAALHRLATDPGPWLCVTPAEALLRRLPPVATLDQQAELVIAGEESGREELCRRLEHLGYEPVSMVQNVGEYSVRGGIVDCFAPGFDQPLRLDFFGDTVESIRLFDPISQRSTKELGEAVLLPAREILIPRPDSPAHARLMERLDREAGLPEDARALLDAGRPFPGIEFFLPFFTERTDTLFGVLPDNALILVTDTPAVLQAATLAWERIEANHQEAAATGRHPLPPDRLFLPMASVRRRLEQGGVITASPFHDDPATQVVAYTTGNHRLLQQELELERRQSGLIARLVSRIQHWLAREERVVLACRTHRRAQQMAELLANHGIDTAVTDQGFHPPPATGLVALHGIPLSEGFDLPEAGVHFLSEPQLFGDRRIGRRTLRRARPKGPRVSFEELRQGDVVVHRQHGIGIYQGLVTMELNGVTSDFLTIAYRDGDKLFVPVDRIDTVTKYKGVGDFEPAIDKLGGKRWQNARRKVKEAVWRVAQELLQLYAKRKLVAGTAFGPPGEFYHELEESFPFEETDGQRRAIADVLADLAEPRPMDRLVCGDVGYGKTEVAVRAAFKVMEDGFQVAMLVPTTVLAEQHLVTFQERFAGLPVSLACLNRFRSPAEQRKIVAGLADGSLDMVIGTHRLLSSDVTFRRLGLLIIDEEHRFGVKAKEKIKKLRTRVDVLTLTATPIPRTLQLSLLGLRDLSVIDTPPARRRAVKTFVARQDDLVLKEAVRRELRRRGQVFVVHNRVHSLEAMAARIQRLAPEARVAMAHGRMPGKTLEEIMVQFVRRQIDVLVCTTIIESGLDIPNANTIVITMADRLGLAEIYQLRGRVGRGNQQAYAYLLLPDPDHLSRQAQQRLRALMDYNELGGGFKLAMSDLQIRGGGNILGESQSGTIAAVGYDLYLELLQKTIEELKAGRSTFAAEDYEPEVSLRLAARLPDDYIADGDQRYLAYRRLAAISNGEEIADFRAELEDRYGPLPEEAANLLRLIELKILMRRLMVERLEQGKSGTLVLQFHPETPVRPERLVAFVQANGGRLTPSGRLVAPARPRAADPILQGKNLLLSLEQDAT